VPHIPWRRFLLLVPPLCLAQAPAPQSTSEEFARVVQPLLSDSCFTCHNSRLKTADLDLEAYARRASVTADRAKWEIVVRMLKARQMPPPGTPRPNDADVKRVTSWLENEFARADQLAKPNPGRVTAHRLNRAEYNNTIRDLLGVEIQAADDFPQDDSVYGFDNIADALSVSPLLMEKYLAAAENIANIAVFGPDLKPEPVRFDLVIPRRMETTNVIRITKPAYYSPSNYDVTGLSQPGSMHLTYRFPIDSEYLFRIVGAGNRPPASEPTQCTFWIDGKLVQTFDVLNVQLSGFERRPDSWEVRLKVPAGSHDLIVAFPRQFDGLPPRFGGPNPSKLPEPPQVDPDKQFAGPPPDKRPGKIEERRIAYQRAKEQFLHPTWDGLSVAELDIIGPYEYVRGPSAESLRSIYTCGHLDGAHGPACSRRILSSLASRAFRRPVTPNELDRLTAIAATAQRRSGSFERGIALGLQAILVWPDFLFRIEKDAPPGGVARPIGDYELASRLSYFLWSSMPDEELMRLAGQGQLENPDIVKSQIKRMLADPKSRALFDNFASEWLEVRRLESVQPDRDRYPDFDDYLRSSMRTETELFFANIIQEDRSILDLIDGRYTFLNERLAAHYGIAGVKGTEFRKVDLTGTNRGGILTHGSVLTVSSYATRTSPVLRGKWVLENIFNAPPPPPPPNVPTLDEAAVGSSATLRQQLEKHRANAVCASCHSRMDPLGFGLENYDAVGAWRKDDGNFPVDSSGLLTDGRTFQGAEGLKAVLRADRDAFAQCVVTKLLMYGLGRGAEPYDQPAIRRIVARSSTSDYRFSSVIMEIVDSVPFRNRAGEYSK
jgi:mono/diheme cytochrome c family protein